MLIECINEHLTRDGFNTHDPSYLLLANCRYVMHTKHSETMAAAFITCTMILRELHCSKAALANSVCMKTHHNPMTHAHGMDNINFTLQEKFHFFGNVIKQLNHAFTCCCASSSYDVAP